LANPLRQRRLPVFGGSLIANGRSYDEYRFDFTANRYNLMRKRFGATH